jgi:hypothetical protein
VALVVLVARSHSLGVVGPQTQLEEYAPGRRAMCTAAMLASENWVGPVTGLAGTDGGQAAVSVGEGQGSTRLLAPHHKKGLKETYRMTLIFKLCSFGLYF